MPDAKLHVVCVLEPAVAHKSPCVVRQTAQDGFVLAKHCAQLLLIDWHGSGGGQGFWATFCDVITVPPNDEHAANKDASLVQPSATMCLMSERACVCVCVFKANRTDVRFAV